MRCFSIKNKGAGESFGKAMADAENRKKLLIDVKESASGQCSVIVTDARTELYYFGENGKTAEKILMNQSGCAETEKYSGKDVLTHLFDFVSGNNPAGEILTAAAVTAFNESKNSDTGGFEMNTVFQAVISFAKKLASEPDIDRAKEMILEIDETLKKLTMYCFRPYAEHVREEISALPLEAIIKRFKEDMNAEQFSAVIESLKKLCKI